jgi:hypothetical protein
MYMDPPREGRETKQVRKKEKKERKRKRKKKEREKKEREKKEREKKEREKKERERNRKRKKKRKRSRKFREEKNQLLRYYSPGRILRAYHSLKSLCPSEIRLCQTPKGVSHFGLAPWGFDSYFSVVCPKDKRYGSSPLGEVV